VLLALLLLLTQQVGVTHIYSHWSGAEQQNFQLTDEDQAEHRKRVAVHKVCAECVSVAQMAAAIVNTRSRWPFPPSAPARSPCRSRWLRASAPPASSSPARPSGLTPKIRPDFYSLRLCRAGVYYFC
jgi:hypothetical protein